MNAFILDNLHISSNTKRERLTEMRKHHTLHLFPTNTYAHRQTDRQIGRCRCVHLTNVGTKRPRNETSRE